ncbi:hypothetical protein IOC51_23760 [Vibrio parahaemolyticus]|nr:hypothetical protein [Vibrio parahaemolyticus]MCD1417040.1 hypothetical protein [Vibrio parahaemolyticus]
MAFREEVEVLLLTEELLSNVVYGGSCSSLLMSLHFFHSIDEANIFHNIR